MPLWELVLQGVSLCTFLLALLAQKVLALLHNCGLAEQRGFVSTLLYYTTAGSGVALAMQVFFSFFPPNLSALLTKPLCSAN